MARVAALKVGSTTDVYSHLLRYFEADLLDWVANANQAHATGARFPRQRILDDLRGGRTVNVPAYALPPSAFACAPSRPGAPIVHGPRRGQPTRIYPGRAIVTPDDQVKFTDDDWARLFLDENNL
jgi:hypothetical protein